MKPIDLAAFVEELARVSGEAILPFFRTAMHAADKSQGGAFDPVTEADRAAEVAMRRLIGRDFPGHGIVGEEFDDVAPGSEFVWVLDPIDGTKSFISGMPTWGTLIGLTHNGAAVYGMMRQPFTRETFVGDGRKPFDIVALIPIVEGAGGIITDWSGGPAVNGGAIIASGDERVHEQALALLTQG